MPRRKVRPGWKRLTEVGTKFQGWEHPSGWQVIHCGHPTANYPWYGVSPDGKDMMRQGGINIGMAFRFLAEAQEAVELHLHNEAFQ